MVIRFGFGAASRCLSGLWAFLIARVHGRTVLALAQERHQVAVQLERERNKATAQAIELLPPGAELLEREPTGRLRIIRMPPAIAGSAPQVRRPEAGTTGELTE